MKASPAVMSVTGERGWGYWRPCLPIAQVPHSHVAITSTADQYIFPRDHSPYTHDMALQYPECVAFGIENMNLRVIESHDDVLRSQMETRDDATVLGNSPGRSLSASPPGSIHQVPLLEMRFVGSEFGPPGIGTVKTPRSRHAACGWQCTWETVVCELGVRNKGLCARPCSEWRCHTCHFGKPTFVVMLHAEVLPCHVIAEKVSPSS